MTLSLYLIIPGTSILSFILFSSCPLLLLIQFPIISYYIPPSIYLPPSPYPPLPREFEKAVLGGFPALLVFRTPDCSFGDSSFASASWYATACCCKKSRNPSFGPRAKTRVSAAKKFFILSGCKTQKKYVAFNVVTKV